MDLGILMFPTDTAIDPGELAREVESRGFESLWFPEHTHMPVDHSPHPSGNELPEMYKRTYDPFVALTAAATDTTDLRLGTGICLVAQHHPINLAKQVASLDRLSGGRFELGIGYGWNQPETEQHGIAFDDRRAFVRESVLAMKQLWTEEVAQYSGDYVQLAPTYQWPKPVQRPHPPILLGAALGERTRAAVVEFCDGWMPIGRRALDDDLPALRGALEAAGRDPDELIVFVYGTKPDEDSLMDLRTRGVDRVGLWLEPGPRESVIPQLDRLAELLEVVQQ
ncbi:MAG: LLM class F420-dependent oxidoreductase [Nitriliruptorales bacterium]|nr:LLM class F420-dependent oxidoreductase [Nitriliruptorales bacterium]